MEEPLQIITPRAGVHQLQAAKIPNGLIGVMFLICALPFLLNVAGVDFGTEKTAVSWSDMESIASNERTDRMFYSLAGSFTHTVLEWSAFMIAIFTALLAFLHFHIKGDVTTPILGVALLCAGAMDAFHTLAADRLIESVADNRNFIPFTWAISRMFNALILMVGVSIFLLKGLQRLNRGMRSVLLMSGFFGVMAYVIIHYCANSAALPQTMYPDSLITRPYDVIPLIVYVVAGLTVFPWFYHHRPGLFTHALLLGMVPQVAVQLHMAFGSTSLFDNHFNIAHFLKIIAYLVPFAGLALEYVRTYQQEAFAVANLQKEKHQREKVEEGHRGLAAIVESSDDAIISQRLDGMVQSWNAGAERIFGYSAEEMLGSTIFKILPPERQGEETLLIKRLQMNQSVSHFETERVRKDQQRIFVSVTLSPIWHKTGKLIGYSKIARDITERKRAEQALEEQNIALSRSNQELDDFAYIASHDLREPLRGIHNYSKILMEDYGHQLDKEAQAKCTTMVMLTVRLEELINSLHSFSRLGRTDLAVRETDLQPIVKDVLANLGIELKERGVTVRIPHPLPTVICDHTRVGEIFRNLITNAMKYNDKMEKWIEIGYIQGIDDLSTSPLPLVFYVRDNGIGIREKHLSSIFKIFKRLHGRDKFGGGAGAGLTMTKKMVERHGGQIRVESTFREGTTFYFTLEKEHRNQETPCVSVAGPVNS